MTDQTETDIAAQVTNALIALGASVEIVAATLLKTASFGRRGSVTSDPVARYVQKTVPGIDRIHALPECCIVYAAGETFIIDTPFPVGRLMQLFDCGRYDALVEGTSERAA